MTLEASKTSLVHELFVHTADENYIACRWCAANGLRVDFFWLAAHALEKYLKAVLLFNGRTSKKYGHDITRLYADVQLVAGPLLPQTLTKPANLDVAWFDRSTDEFVAHLHNEGNADNRYLIYGYLMKIEDLFMLDQVVFAVRRLVCRLDERWMSVNEPGAPRFTNRELLTRQPDYGNRLFLPLDKLIDARENCPRRIAALNFNFPFAPSDFVHERMRVSTGSQNPVIGRRILDELPSNNPVWAAEAIEVARWFLANVQVPPGVRDQIEQAVAQARQRHALP